MDYWSFLPTFVIQVILVFGVFRLASSSGRNKWGWTIVSMVPVMGIFFTFLLLLCGVATAIEKQGAILAKLSPAGGGAGSGPDGAAAAS